MGHFCTKNLLKSPKIRYPLKFEFFTKIAYSPKIPRGFFIIFVNLSLLQGGIGKSPLVERVRSYNSVSDCSKRIKSGIMSAFSFSLQASFNSLTLSLYTR